ncbi:hypothetical protein MVEN_02489300 [Mycena venus]|uniref:SH3 domain-containing protein n=1 Tax=Mycena venus TaxID=2733690 RepID=A0A8H6WXW5_9AGAR|nr:hypothetical protein MVEN_02489300 [Mycena venus]
MPSLRVFTRNDDSLSPSSSLGPEYIAAIGIVGAIVVCLFIWLGIRRYRRRAQAKREQVRIAAFTPVRGVYREPAPEKEFLPENLQAIQGTTFSREQLTRSVVLPQRVVTRPERGVTDQDILDFHRQSGTFPKPFTFALSAGSPAPAPADGASRSSWVRYSNASSLATSNRFSVISSSSSVDSTPTTGTPRKVRQLFSPVLPDELLLTSLGERLTVVQAFDDGWVVVGRTHGAGSALAQPKSLFKSASPAEGDSVELGVVPAWCFLKPVKGLRAERPVRSTSLGITVQMDGPSFSSRNELLSWSNF